MINLVLGWHTRLMQAYVRASISLACLVLVAPYGLAATPRDSSSTMTSPLAADVQDTSVEMKARRNRVLQLSKGDDTSYAGPKKRSFDVLAATALKGCSSKEWPDYMASLPSTKPDESPDTEPIEMFALPPLVRYLYQFGDCMSPEQKQRLLDGLTKKQRLTGGGTSNHAAMRATSWYLLAQYFPNAEWHDWDGKPVSSPQLMSTLKSRLTARTARIFQSGLDEWLSPTYAIVNLYTMLNLADFARDPVVQQSASDEATLQVSVMRLHSFHGVLVPPITRKNFEQRNGPQQAGAYTPSVAQQILWYYFGEPPMSDFDLRSDREPFYVSMLALSNWVPPPALSKLAASGSSKGHEIKVVTPQFGEWGVATPPAIYGDSYIANDFAIGTGNLIFDPSWYNDHTQTFSILLQSKSPQNAIECFQPFWSGNKGEDEWGTDRSSPFQQMYRYDDSSVVMLFDIPQRDPWVYDNKNRFYMTRNDRADALLQMFECRIPKSFDQIVTESRWVFVRQNDIFVAIGTLGGENEYDKVSARVGVDYRVFKVRQARGGLFLRVERARPDMDFAKFQQQVRAHLPSYDQASSSATIENGDGTTTKVAFQLKKGSDGKYWSSIPLVTRGGVIVPTGGNGPISSDALTLREGVLETKVGSQSLRIAHQVAR